MKGPESSLDSGKNENVVWLISVCNMYLLKNCPVSYLSLTSITKMYIFSSPLSAGLDRPRRAILVSCDTTMNPLLSVCKLEPLKNLNASMKISSTS